MLSDGVMSNYGVKFAVVKLVILFIVVILWHSILPCSVHIVFLANMLNVLICCTNIMILSWHGSVYKKLPSKYNANFKCQHTMFSNCLSPHCF